MPVHIKAFIIVFTLSAVALYLGRRAVCPSGIRPSDYQRRASLWLLITASAFLSHNYWIFVVVTLPLILWAGGKDSSRFGLYLFLLFVIPPFAADIRKGSIGHFFVEMDHLRWLALMLLLPAYLALRSRPGSVTFGKTTVDKLVLSYLLLDVAMEAAITTFTNVARHAIDLFLDVFLPYYVASRSLRTLDDCRDAVSSFVIAVLVMVPVALFEFFRNWLMYSGLGQVMGLSFWGFGNTLNRGDGVLRAQVTTGHPIVLGYLMSTALGLMTFMRPVFASKPVWLLTCGALGVGLIAAMSRGPWVGAGAMLLLLLVTGPKVQGRVMRALVLGALALPVLLVTPFGQKIIDYLPFIGTVESQNVEFRQRLFEVTMGVLAHFPVFGTWGQGYHPDLEQLRGNDGLIDMVNTYLGVALNKGVVGLTVFCAPFIFVGWRLLTAMRLESDKDGERHRLARALAATLLGILVTIATVAPIVAVPVVYWLIVGLSAGCLRLLSEPAVTPDVVPLQARAWRDARGRPYVARMESMGTRRAR